MRRECVEAVTKALGRDLNQVEAREIEERIVKNARALATADPAAWLAKSKAQRLTEAGQRAAAELLGEARLKAEREALQIAANVRVDTHLADMQTRGIDRLDALDRMMAFHADGKAKGLSVETAAKAVRRDFLRQLLPVMEASNPKWFGLFENIEGVTAIIKEIHGEDSGNPVAKAGAKVWHEVAEKARERFNAAGGDIGKIDDWGMPHHHSQVRVARAGREQWLATLPRAERLKAQFFDTPPPRDFARDHWVGEILPRLKRERYVNEDGSRMNDTQLTEFLREAWVTIATGGANKNTPGQFTGSGMRANRGNATRQIHFKDAQAYLDYQAGFGEKSLFEVLVGHVDGISKDIALVEELGPNPDHAARMFREQAVQQMAEANPAELGKIRKRAIRSENLYNFVAGRTLPVASERLAQNFDTVRNWLTGSRLGGAVISSLTDDATLHLTARINDLPAMQVLKNELAALNPANRTEERMAQRAGLALDTFIASLNRFGQEGLGDTFSKKLASTVLRASGLNAITEARRRAFGVTAMGSIGSVTKDHANLSDVALDDHRILKAKGVTDADFNVWKAAQLEDWGNGNDTMLTPDAIYRTSDAAIDQAIGPRIQKLKDQAQAETDSLKLRDIEDRGWVAARAAKLSKWAQQEAAKVDAKLKKADATTAGELTKAKAAIGRLSENIDALAESWSTPPDANTPGVSNRERVGAYGKGQLRKKGVDEGRAREATRNLNAEIAQMKRNLESTRLDAVKEFFGRFRERQAELAEFTRESDARVGKREKVRDRIDRELTPQIERARVDAREKAVTRLLGVVLEETDMAVIEPGAKERAMMGHGIQRGTWKGEIARSFFLFKSFPLAMVTRHWMRGMSQPNRGGRAAYLSTLLAATTVLGAMAMQVKEVIAGRDPRNLNPFAEHGVRNWMKAMLQGGSLGLYGDFLFSESTQHGQSPVASFLGPVVGLGEDAFKLTQGNIVQAMSGDDTDFGAEAVKFVRNNLPGANLWYTKAAMDHLFWNQLAEYMNPGYLSRVRRRAQTQFGQDYWWDPQDVLPDRAPDLTAVAGE